MSQIRINKSDPDPTSSLYRTFFCGKQRLFNINKVIYTKIENVEFQDKNNTCYTFITLSTTKKIKMKHEH